MEETFSRACTREPPYPRKFFWNIASMVFRCVLLRFQLLSLFTSVIVASFALVASGGGHHPVAFAAARTVSYLPSNSGAGQASQLFSGN